MISTLVIAGLALMWLAVLLPDLFTKISRSRRSDTIRSFNSQLSSLGRSAPVDRGDNVIDLRARTTERRSARNSLLATGGIPSPYSGSAGLAPQRPVAVTGSTSPSPVAGTRTASHAVRKRRQDVLIALGAAAVLTLLATVAFGGVFLYLHLVADVLMAAYLVALQRVVTNQGAQHANPPLGSSSPSVAVSGFDPTMLHPQRIAN